MPDCPSVAELEELIAGRGEAAVRDHVASCPRCEMTAVGLRDNLALAAQVRSVLQEPRPAPPDPQAPVLAGYRILGLLNEGAQGVVYQALQESTKRTVAIKFLHHGVFSSSRQQRRFEREIDLVASLRHPGIVTVHESGITAAGQLYCVMEFVDGVPIDEFVRAARDPLRDRVQLFARVCQAVHHAHRHGVLHRDLKPSNVFVDRHGEPRVLDFGLARALDARDPEAATQSAVLTTRKGEFLGTLAYASPEQLEVDPGKIDVRSDVYSLGVIFYELLAGRRPYEVSSNVAASVRTIQEVVPAAPSRIGARSDRDLDTIALCALQKDRERRYSSAGAFAADLENWLQGRPIEARRDSTVYVLRKTLQRHWLVSFSIAMVCIVSLSAAVIANYFRAIAKVETARAEQSAQRAQHESERANATAERERQQAMNAERKAEESEPVRALLEELITANDPERALGREPTVREILDQAGPRIAATLSDEPLVQAKLQLTIGRAYASLHEPLRAEPPLKSAVLTYERLQGRDHPDTVGALSAWIALCLQQARYDDAEQAAGDAIARLDRAGLGHGRLAAELWQSFSAAAFGRIAVEDAIAREEHALAILESAPQPDDVAIAAVEAELATLHGYHDELEPAEQLMAQALAVLRSHADERPALLVQTLLKAQQLARMRRGYADSAKLLHEAHALCTRMYGREDSYSLRLELAQLDAQWREHDFRVDAAEVERAFELEPLLVARTDPNALEALVTLANFAASTHDLARAERLSRLVVDASRERQAQNDVVLVGATEILGAAIALQSRYADAQPILQRALDLGDALHGAGEKTTHKTAALLAFCKTERGDASGLEPLVRRGMAALQPGVHEVPGLLIGEARVAQFLLKLGNPTFAEQVARHAVDRMQEEYGDQKLNCEPLNVLAQIVREQGRLDEALDLANRALDAVQTSDDGDDYWEANALQEIGINLRYRGRLEEAEQKVSESLAIYGKLGAPSRPYHVAAVHTLGMIRLQRGDFAGAEASFKELVAVYRRRQPGEARMLGLVLSQLGAAYLGAERLTEADATLREAFALLAGNAVANDEWKRWALDDWIAVNKKLGRKEEVERLERLRSAK
ncbi:MAG: serine/threonine-protein kinase [Planctomycetota bacterium]